jgi:hypothetical protein
MYDPRLIMDMVHRYGRATAELDHARAGVLYAEISRALTAVPEVSYPPTADRPRTPEPQARS